MTLLLVEDNVAIAKGLEYSLKNEGYDILIAFKANEARLLLESKKIDLVLLDITLPDGNGFDLYEKKIEVLKIPTIFLTAKDDEDDIVKGLEIGAEDYITKPFSTKELLARINKILNRNKKNNIIICQNIAFDMDKMEVFKDGKKVELTSLEIKILKILFLNLDKVVSRNTILDKIWEWTGNDVDDHTVTVYIKRIREKLQSDIILTIKGIGYRIDKDEK